ELLPRRRRDPGYPRRQDGDRGRRRGPRERGRPRLCGHDGDARDHQLHGDARARPHLPGAHRRARGRAGPAPDDRQQHRGPHHRLHRVGGRGAPLRRDHRHQRVGPRQDHPGVHGPGERAVRPAAAGARLSPARAGGRRAAARGADGGVSGPGAARGAAAGRGDLRDHERGRHHGPSPRAGRVRGAARHEVHHRRADRGVPAEARAAGAPRGRGGDPHALWRVAHDRLPQRRGRARARGHGEGRLGRARGDAGADALRVPHGRRVPLAALRLRRAARHRHGAHQPRGERGDRVPAPGRAGDRPREQAARLQPAGPGDGHGGGQRGARLPPGPARLRDRRADPAGPGAHLGEVPDQQPQEDRGAGRLRPLRCGAGAAGGRAEPVQRGVPEHQARQDGPPLPGHGGRGASNPRGGRTAGM
ncbi:MAG: 3,4-dihydroxy-2-butanone 4-phosphate synthase / GTP cyclohydrolase II, partial [uncultured Gemmatimonadetes bacterium]